MSGWILGKWHVEICRNKNNRSLIVIIFYSVVKESTIKPAKYQKWRVQLSFFSIQWWQHWCDGGPLVGFKSFFFFFFFGEVFPLFCPPPGFSAVSGGSISREDDGTFWQLVSSLLHDLAGPSRALRHSIPSVAVDEQEGGGVAGGEAVSGGQRSSPGAEGFSSSSPSHSLSKCFFSLVSRSENLDFLFWFSCFGTFTSCSGTQCSSTYRMNT